MRDTVFITAETLARDPSAHDIIAVGGHPGLPRIPGAIDADMARDFAAPGGGTRGSRPLPDIATLQATARAWGLGSRPVVLYDHDRCLTAARGWWVLRWAGLAQVRLLDGGFAAWRAAGLPTSMDAPSRTPSDIMLTAGHMPELDADGAQAAAAEGRLLDTRVRVNYIGGATPPGAPGRGHIPGAISAPAHDALMEDGRFADDATLRHLFHALGADGARPVAVSCGAGVSAAHTVAALAAIGIPTAMYPGSWSAWSADPARPVTIGARP